MGEVPGQGLLYEVRTPAKNGIDTQHLATLNGLEPAMGYIIDLMILNEGGEMSLAEYIAKKEKRFRQAQDILQPRKELEKAEVE